MKVTIISKGRDENQYLLIFLEITFICLVIYFLLFSMTGSSGRELKRRYSPVNTFRESAGGDRKS